METLEELYQDRAFEEIVDRFASFLGRYKEIFNPKTSTRKVIGLTKAYDIRRTLALITHSGDSDQVHQMRTMLIESFGYEEMCQVIYLAFMVTLNRYDPGRKVPLQKYIYSVYPYYLSIEIGNLVAPPYNERNRVTSREALTFSTEGEEDLETEALMEGIDAAIELDYRWVSGETCGEPFICLTPLERKILVMVIVDNMTQEEIGQEMGYHFSSVKRKKMEIVAKLKKRMEGTKEP